MREYFSELFRLALYCLKGILFVGTFVPFFTRRKRFSQANALFILGGLLCCALGAGLWILGQGNMALELGIYGLLTQIGIVWLVLCCQGSLSKYIFYYFYALILQTCCRALEGSLQLLGVLPSLIGGYVAGMETQQTKAELVSLVISFLFCVCVYLLNRRRSERAFSAQLNVDKSYVLMASINVSVIGWLYYMIILPKELDPIYTLVLYTLIIVYSISVVYSQHNVLLRSQSEQMRQKAEYENLILAQLSQEAFRQYSSLKETMDHLNVRCHDIKHQLRGLVQNGGGESQYFDQLIDTIQIYDCVVKTGNEALDIVLTDAALRCNSANISFTCLIDGPLLSDIETPDIYSLFGNAVDNAIEYLQTVELDGKFLRISVEAKGSFTLIRAENYFQGHLLRDRDGVLQTTKEQGTGHGYGVKSIGQIAEKYDGTLTIKEEDHMFQLLVLLPRKL